MSREVVVVPTGTANLASVASAFGRMGIDMRMAADARAIRDAARVVLPGVGAFGSAMAALRERDLIDALRDRIARDRPLLAICLGMQLLGRGSKESPGEAGIAAFDFTCVRLPSEVRVPHMGWNSVQAPLESSAFVDGEAYFAHSYCVEAIPEDAAVAWTTHGVRFVAAFERGALLACQFHPELSGSWGASLIERWCTAGSAISC